MGSDGLDQLRWTHSVDADIHVATEVRVRVRLGSWLG